MTSCRSGVTYTPGTRWYRFVRRNALLDCGSLCRTVGLCLSANAPPVEVGAKPAVIAFLTATSLLHGTTTVPSNVCAPSGTAAWQSARFPLTRRDYGDSKRGRCRWYGG